MSTLTTVPRGTTTFKPYDKPRYSKAKRYITMNTKGANYQITGIELDQICKNCHYPYGKHSSSLSCPEYQILNK